MSTKGVNVVQLNRDTNSIRYFGPCIKY